MNTDTDTRSTVALARAAILRRLTPAVDVLAHDPNAGDGAFTEAAIRAARATSRAAILEVLLLLKDVGQVLTQLDGVTLRCKCGESHVIAHTWPIASLIEGAAQ